ncbi:hypothetical protein BJV78DRAFT_1394391 [Lactifluus subvellereus]|nr:hypothetical protein BJV78DRAFT_1394391 [Lactifluus subvellereus]
MSHWQAEGAKLLVECGANVQARNNNGETPLYLAWKGGYHDTMRLLLDRGADVDAQDDNYLTPLHLISELLLWSYRLQSFMPHNAYSAFPSNFPQGLPSQQAQHPGRPPQQSQPLATQLTLGGIRKPVDAKVWQQMQQQDPGGESMHGGVMNVSAQQQVGLALNQPSHCPRVSR